MIKKLFIPLLIFSLALGLRIYKLDIRPLGFTWDEAALGYNAYSLLLTGRDEYRTPLPVVLKSFGDYKPGLYAYLTTPSVAVLGLSEFSTRLPSAIVGSLLVLTIYLLASQLFSSRVGLISAVLLAINPWAIHFSRGAWEANLSLFLATLAVVLYISSYKIQNTIYLILSSLFFGLTLWSYQGAKLTTPLLLVTLFFISKFSKKLVAPSIIFLVVISPIIFGLQDQSGRLGVLSVFNYSRSHESVTDIKNQEGTLSSDLVFAIYHSELLDQVRGVVERYLNHFSPRFLFFEGDWSNLRHSTPYYGYLHIPELITIFIGLFVLFKKPSSSTLLIFAWLIIAPMASSLSRDVVSGVRSLPMVIPLTVISAIGLSEVFRKRIIFVILSLSLFASVIYYLDLYYIHAPYYSGSAWLYPYKRAIQLVNQNINDFERVIFTNTLGQPYIYVLFYNQVDLRTYQPWAKLNESQTGDVGEVASWGKYLFRKVDWPHERGSRSTIFVGNQFELPEIDMNPSHLVRLGEIEYPNGLHALRIVGLK